MKTVFTRTFVVGTVVTYRQIKKVVQLTIELRGTGELSICGQIGKGNNPESCGQVIMSFKEYDYRGHWTLDDIETHNEEQKQKVKELFDIWDRWHLNHMKAGSPSQEDFLRRHPITEYHSDQYARTCEQLNGAGLNPDPNYLHNGEPYKYGHAWLKEELPQDVYAKLVELCNYFEGLRLS